VTLRGVVLTFKVLARDGNRSFGFPAPPTPFVLDPGVFPPQTSPDREIDRVRSLPGLSLSLKDRCSVHRSASRSTDARGPFHRRPPMRFAALPALPPEEFTPGHHPCRGHRSDLGCRGCGHPSEDEPPASGFRSTATTFHCPTADKSVAVDEERPGSVTSLAAGLARTDTDHPLMVAPCPTEALLCTVSSPRNHTSAIPETS
jgi:hypothetical protein